MRRLRLPTLLLALLFSAGCELLTSPSALETEQVLIRVFNNSDYRFENVVVNDVPFGAIPSAEFSSYHEVEGAYHYGAIDLEIKGQPLGLRPIDYMGETPLPPGRYTYLLSPDLETGQLLLRFYVGDEMPRGRQQPGRSRMVSLERRFELNASAPAADGGAAVAGTRITVREINPTVSARPGSSVIYIPDARLLGITHQGVLLKLSPTGQRQWLRSFGEDDRWQKGIRSVVPAPDGGLLLAGARIWPAGEDDRGWEGDAWLIRTTAAGEEVWSRRVGRPGVEELVATARNTPDGGYVIAGSSAGLPWLAKTDAEGREIWSRALGSGTAMNYVEAVHPLPDGGYVLTGDRHGVKKETGGGTLIRTDAAGMVQWTTRFDGSGEALLPTDDGGFVVAGSLVDKTARVARFDAGGQVLWTRRYPLAYYARALAAAPDGGFVLAGGIHAWLLKVEEEGAEEWHRTWPAFPESQPAEARAVQPTADGGFLLVGSAGHRGRIIKTDTQGQRQWEHTVTEP